MEICSSTNMNKIQILLNKLMKMLLKLDRRTLTNYLHKKLNICNINDIYVCCLINFINVVLYGRCPDIFKNYFEFRSYVYYVRRKEQVKIPAARLPFGGKAVRIHGAPSGINYIHLLFGFDWKMFQEKGENLLNFKIFLRVNKHDHILFACGILIFIVTMK